MKLGIISLLGYSSKLIGEEAKKYFEKVDMIDIKQTEINVSTEAVNVVYNAKKLEKYDCVYLRGSFKYALLKRAITRALQGECYLPIKPDSFTVSHDKFLSLIELQRKGVTIPKTYFAATTETAKKLLDEVCYPVIIKVPSGTHGKGVMFADSISSARSVLDALETFNQPYILQEYLESNASDIRVVVAGKEVIAAMKRKAMDSGELRANIHAGGKGFSCEISDDMKQIAIKSAKAIGADVCAVDILDSAKPAVVEVNLSPGLRGITKATGINVADKVAKALFESTEEFKRDMENGKYKGVIKDLDIKEVAGKVKPGKEILTSLNVKGGMIKLPKVITDLTKFGDDDDVVIVANKGKLEIREYKIKKEA